MITRYRPKGLNETLRVEDIDFDCFYSRELKIAIIYVGNSDVHHLHYKFSSEDEMMQRIDREIKKFTERKQIKKNIYKSVYN